METQSIVVENLSFTHTGEEQPLLSNLTFNLPKGATLAIFAAADCGKSTLAKILAALIPKYRKGEMTGTVEVEGLKLTEVEPWDLTEVLTLVDQNVQDQLLMTTCEDEIAFPLESLEMERALIQQRVSSALKSWGLEPLAKANPQELSGGERKRLLLAVADAIDAPVWILDEPFEDLDATWRHVLRDKIIASQRTVLLFASRYVAELYQNFSHFAFLERDGLTFGTQQEIVEHLTSRDQKTIAPSRPLEKAQGHLLRCTAVQMSHQRTSLQEHKPFSLEAKEFSLQAGEVVALTGPNGAGKSTFSRLLCGLETPERGLCSFDEHPITPKALQRVVSYLFQNPDYELFMATVKDELLWSLRAQRLSSHEREEKLKECAELFQLNLSEPVATMGYGRRKQLQGAVHYLLDRPFYILDELDSGLTYTAAYQMIDHLRSKGAGILVISHDPSFAASLATRRYRMERGILEEEVR